MKNLMSLIFLPRFYKSLYHQTGFVFICLVALTFSGNVRFLRAQTKAGAGGSAFEIMDRVYQHIQYPEGFNKIQLTITTKEGRTVIYKGVLYQKTSASLFTFDSLSRGSMLKLLYNDQGQNIYAYLIHDKRLFHKKFLDRFESVLDSGFTYYDLNNSPFLENYTQKISGTEKSAEGLLTVVENIPLDKGLYGKLVFLVNPRNENRVHRIDYYDSAITLMKTMTFTYGKLPVKDSKKSSSIVEYPIKWDIADLSHGTVSTLEFFSSDKTARLDVSLFKKENIEK